MSQKKGPVKMANPKKAYSSIPVIGGRRTAPIRGGGGVGYFKSKKRTRNENAPPWMNIYKKSKSIERTGEGEEKGVRRG